MFTSNRKVSQGIFGSRTLRQGALGGAGASKKKETKAPEERKKTDWKPYYNNLKAKFQDPVKLRQLATDLDPNTAMPRVNMPPPQMPTAAQIPGTAAATVNGSAAPMGASAAAGVPGGKATAPAPGGGFNWASLGPALQGFQGFMQNNQPQQPQQMPMLPMGPRGQMPQMQFGNGGWNALANRGGFY